MLLLESFTNYELLILLGLLPAVFVFLWILIVVDIKNFMGSRRAYSVFTAKDPVNCYQGFPMKTSD